MGKIAIVGAGVSGLCTGIYLQKAGYSCEIFEKNHFVGGNCTGWERDGYHIDNCIHWLTGTHPKSPLYQDWLDVGMFDKDTKMFFQESLFSSEYQGQTVHFYHDTERAKREMTELSPEDGDEIERFFEAVEISEKILLQEGTLADKIKQVLSVISFARLSLSEYATRFKHPLLRKCFCDYIGKEFVTMGLVLAYATFASGNGKIPLGGSVACAKRLEEKFLSVGGKIHIGYEVESVQTEDKRVTSLLCKNQESFAFEKIVFSCDPVITFSKFLPTSAMPYALARAEQNEKSFLPFSAFHVAFAWQNKELPFSGTFAFETTPFQVGFESYDRIALREYSFEPSYARKDCNIVQTMFFLKEPTCRFLIDLREHSREKYILYKANIAKEILHRLKNRFPEYADDIKILDIWTPATYHRYFDSLVGSFMSLAPTGKRLPTMMPCKVRGYDNVYLAGQWQLFPGGLPICLKSAKEVVKKIEAEEKRKQLRYASL